MSEVVGKSEGKGKTAIRQKKKSQIESDQEQDCFSSIFCSAQKNDPPADPEILEHLDKSDKNLNVEIKTASAHYPPGSSDNVKEINEKAKRSGIMYVDQEFPPTQDSLFKIDKLAALKGESTSPTDDGNLPLIEWRRPQDFLNGTAANIFDGKIEFNDISQGQLGDCWLLCSIAALSEFEYLVKQLFVEDECNVENGTFVVKLCKDGFWQTIVLDSFVPCIPKGGPIYSKANGPELWVILLEKAFAKYNGSYAAIRSGFPYEALYDLTGAPCKEILIEDENTQAAIEDGSLWRKLVKYDSYSYVMTLATPGEDNMTEGGERNGGGLVPGHAYTLIGVHEQNDIKLCKIRNPWGSFEWNGDWCDSDSKWTEELKKEFGHSTGDDGIFFMSFEDVVREFVGINICLIRHKSQTKVAPWKEERKKFEYKFKSDGICILYFKLLPNILIFVCIYMYKTLDGHGVESVPLFRLVVSEPNAELFAIVHQPDKRRIGTPVYFDIGVTILKEVGTKKYEVMASSGNAVDRQHQLECNPGTLGAGTYIVVPTSTGCIVENERQKAKKVGKNITQDDLNRQAVLSFHCEYTKHPTNIISFYIHNKYT